MLNMTEQEIELLLDRAAKKGAQEALRTIGLSDQEAYGDMREIRNLLDAWRATKQTVGQTVAKVLTTAILTALAAGIWMSWGDK
tara:strand:- start:52 stop:303 length:252 start_codon:yes stop_codon:yes gene_type:complete